MPDFVPMRMEESLLWRREADVVVVPAWFADGRAAGEDLRSLLKTAHARGAGVVGLCLGAIPLAEAGLIGGRRAVTHWRAFEPLAREHPKVALDESILYVDQVGRNGR